MRLTDLPIYIDIDGTLTDNPKKSGKPIEARIDKVRRMAQAGIPVVLWSACGEEYVRVFCQKHCLGVHQMLGKPQFCVDDNSEIRPNLKVQSPRWLDT